jgi:excisionase family DNA binding protein
MKAYSVIEAAAELGVSPNLVYALCQRRKIRHERHGVGRGKIVIPEDALQEYRASVTVQVEEGEGTATPPPRRKSPNASMSGGFTMLDADRLQEAWASRR